MLYRVQCVDKSTGQHSDRIYRAESADRAAEMALKEGYIVGHVYPHAEPPIAPAPTGRLASYAKKAERPSGVLAFLNFEVFLFPVLIRVLFAISLGLTLLLSVAAPLIWLLGGASRGRVGAMEVAVAIAGSWVWVIGLRLVFEVWVVFFSMHDQLREINRNTAARE